MTHATAATALPDEPLRSRRPNALSIVAAAWAPRTWAATLHLLLNLAFGTFYFTVLVTGLSAGLGLAVSLLGIPVLMLTGMFVRVGGSIERWRVRHFLGLDLRDPYRVPPEGSFWKRTLARATDPALWRDLVYLLLRFPVGLATFTVVLTMWTMALSLALLPLYAWALPEPVMLITSDTLVDTPLEIALACVVGLALTVPAAWAVRGLASLERLLASALLGASATQLQARVGELATSRARTVDAAAEERRRIERDLHDGAQQRLVALAMDLGMALQKMKSEPDAAEALVRQAHEEAKRALVELRDLARGIHPAVLTDRGLDAAISALAARSPVPVSVDVSIAPRPSPATEAIAYFVVAEALTNVARHASATSVSVTARRTGDRLVIEVRDNGAGGASARAGGGLAGLAERVASVDGKLAIASPIGGPTTLSAEIPCVS